MSEHPKHLPADERRAATVEAVINLAAEQNPSDITTTAIAQRMGLAPDAYEKLLRDATAVTQVSISRKYQDTDSERDVFEIDVLPDEAALLASARTMARARP